MNVGCVHLYVWALQRLRQMAYQTEESLHENHDKQSEVNALQEMGISVDDKGRPASVVA